MGEEYLNDFFKVVSSQFTSIGAFIYCPKKHVLTCVVSKLYAPDYHQLSLCATQY